MPITDDKTPYVKNNFTFEAVLFDLFRQFHSAQTIPDMKRIIDMMYAYMDCYLDEQLKIDEAEAFKSLQQKTHSYVVENDTSTLPSDQYWGWVFDCLMAREAAISQLCLRTKFFPQYELKTKVVGPNGIHN